MGEVFLAHDRERDERIALKVLSHTAPAALVRFKREFRSLRGAHHRNLVQLGELFAANDGWFFTMEYVEGEPFSEYVRRMGMIRGAESLHDCADELGIETTVRGGDAWKATTAAGLEDTVDHGGEPPSPWDEGVLRSCFQQLVLGLLALHDGGMIHRDVKPTNVLVTPEQRVVILDFGLVAQVDAGEQSTEGRGVGTPVYMSPEQAAGASATEASDWYSVGTMLFEVLTGSLPFTGSAMRIFLDKQQKNAPSPHALAPDAPRDLRDLCERLLAIEPRHRPSSREISACFGIDRTNAPSSTMRSRGLGQGVFVGRLNEFRALQKAFAHARTGTKFVVIDGESGIGKTELMHRFAAELLGANPALITLDSRCFENESVPYKALDGAIDRLARELARWPNDAVLRVLPKEAALLPKLFPALRRVDAIATAANSEGGPEDSHERRRRVLQALRLLLRRVSEQVPILLTIDDLQWADRDSFSLLRAIFAPPKSPAVLVVVTHRAGLGDQEQHAATLFRDLDAERLPLSPLTEDEAAALVRSVNPAFEGSKLLDTIVQESHGHPLFVRELASFIADREDESSDIRLEGVLAARVDMLSEPARHLLAALCAASAPLPIEVATQLTELGEGSLDRTIASLRVAQLARTQELGARTVLEPYHGRVREAVLSRLSEPETRALHGRLARALEASGGGAQQPQLLVTHFSRAGDRERAAHYAEDAAERAEAALAFAQAAELWKVALTRFPNDGPDRRRTQSRLGDALMSAGMGAQAAAAYIELSKAAGIDRSEGLVCRRKAAEQLLLSGRLFEGGEVLERLLEEVGVHRPKTRRRALLSIIGRRLWLRLRGVRYKPRERRDVAEAELVRLDILCTAGKGLALVDALRGTDCQIRAFLMALRVGDSQTIGETLAIESSYQARQGSLSRAAALMKRAVAVAETVKNPHLDAVLTMSMGVNSYFAGQFVEAATQCQEAVESLNRLPASIWEANIARLFGLWAMREIGDLGKMRVEYERHLGESIRRGDRYAESSIRRSAVRVWLADDDVVGASSDVDMAQWEAPSSGYHVAHFHELTARGEIALYSGDFADWDIVKQLRQLRASLFIRVVTVRTQANYLVGRLALAGAEIGVDDNLAEATRLARSLRREGLGFASAWGAVLSAGVAARRGDTERMLSSLTDVQDLAAAHDMRLLRAAAGYRQSQLLGVDRGRKLADWSQRELERLAIRDPDRMSEMLMPGVGGKQASLLVSKERRASHSGPGTGVPDPPPRDYAKL